MRIGVGAALAATFALVAIAPPPSSAQSSCRPVQECYNQPLPPKAIPYQQRVCYPYGLSQRCEMQTRYRYEEQSQRVCKTRTQCSNKDLFRRVKPRKG